MDSWPLAKQWQPTHQSFNHLQKSCKHIYTFSSLHLRQSEQDKQYLRVHMKTNLINLTLIISFIKVIKVILNL